MPAALRLTVVLLGVGIAAAAPRIASGQADELRVSRNLERKLKRDAARLALRIGEGEDLRFQSVHIPPRDMTSLYDALLAMYKADEGVRAIFRCNVHTRPDPSIDHMLVIFDRDTEWARPLRQGRHETESVTINELLYDHDLIIEKHLQWDDARDAISIRSKRPLNMASLANEFYNVEGVQEIDLGIAKGVGNDITAQRMARGWRFTFELSFGSLSDAANEIHTWRYEITDDGAVAMVGESGEPVPEWMRCSLEPLLARRGASR